MMMWLSGNSTRGRGPSITFSIAGSSISKDDWLLLPRHDTTHLMGHVFYGVVGVICCAAALLSQQTWKSLVCGVISCMAAAWRRSFHPCSGPALPAQPSGGPPSVGEIVLMCQLFHGGRDIVTVEGAQ